MKGSKLGLGLLVEAESMDSPGRRGYTRPGPSFTLGMVAPVFSGARTSCLNPPYCDSFLMNTVK